MSRVAPLEPPYARHIDEQFNQVMRGAPPLTLFRVLAGNPRAWDKFRAGSLLDDGPLSLRDREIVINRTCALTKCEYEWGVHVVIFADAAQLSDKQINATVLGGADEACWSTAEKALIAAVDGLHFRSTLSGDEFEALSLSYDTKQIFEILLLCGFYHTVSYFANGLDIPMELQAARFPERSPQTPPRRRT